MKDESYYRNFPGAKEIESQLLPLISEYNFSSLILAAFTINSWRNNRAAQRSCLSLNSSISKCINFGNKNIETYQDFVLFFENIKDILSVNFMDDPVINDFGEVKLLFDGDYYSIITGTGHSFPVFAALQFLETIVKRNQTKKKTKTLLHYVNSMIGSLYDFNGTGEYNTTPLFECPSERYYYKIKEFLRNESWKSVDSRIVSAFNIEHCSIDTAHFIKYQDTYFPLFNPSIIFDYYITQSILVPQNEKASLITNSLIQKIQEIYIDECKCGLIIKNVGFTSKGKRIPTKLPNSFLVITNELSVFFIDISNWDEETYNNQVKEIQRIHQEGNLIALDYGNVKKGKHTLIRAIDVTTNYKLRFINYSEYIGSNSFSLQFFPNSCTALDLMFMIIFSNDISNICDFFAIRGASNTQILSFGGLADSFSYYIEDGELNKGATSVGIATFECDSAADYIYEKYVGYCQWFPFNLKMLSFPENYIIHNIGDSSYSLTKKSDYSFSNYFFNLNEAVQIYTQFDMLNLYKSYSLKEAELKTSFFRSLINDFFVLYKSEIIGSNCFKEKVIHILCTGFSENVPDNQFFVFDKVVYGSKQIDIWFSAHVDRIMNEISQASDRHIELKAICELFSPIFKYSEETKYFFRALLNKYSSQKKTINATGYKVDYYFNTESSTFHHSEEQDSKVRKIIAKEVLHQNIVSGKYGGKEATRIIRPIQSSVFRLMIEIMKKYNHLELHTQLLSYLASEQFELYIKRKNYELSEDLSESAMKKSKEISNSSYIECKNTIDALKYLIETNLSITEERENNALNNQVIQELFPYASWLVTLQTNADLCYNIDFCDNEDFITQIEVLDDYRIHIETGNEFFEKNKAHLSRMQENSLLVFDEPTINEEYLKKFLTAFQTDTGIDFQYLLAFLDFLYTLPYNESIQKECEISENVISISSILLYKEAKNVLDDSFTEGIINSLLNFLTINVSHIMDFRGKQSDLLPIWDRENRPDRIEVAPLYLSGDQYIYSPITIYELKNRWWHGIYQFFLPYEKGLNQSISILTDWKSQYEHLFSRKIAELFKSHGFEYAEYDVDIRKRDRKGTHPPITELGDYDVIGLDKRSRRVFIIECKFLQKISTVFEHSKEQHRFFFKEKFDEKFQKRIDYFSKVYRSYFENQGICIANDEYEITPYMVVNKVFVSYYKQVNFPIITYDEIKSIINS